MENPKMQKNKRTGFMLSATVSLLIGLLALVGCQAPAATSTPAANQGFTGLNGGGGGDDTLGGQFGFGGGGGQFGGPNGNPNFQFTPAKELPTTPADVTGQVTRIDSQSMFVSQRGGRGGFRPGPDGTPQPQPTPAGTPVPNIEVVFTADTVVYKDVTPRPNFQNNGSATPSAPVTIQQQVQAGAVTDMAVGYRVTVWGTKNGNQITAKIVVYTQAVPRQQPQPNQTGGPTG